MTKGSYLLSQERLLSIARQAQIRGEPIPDYVEEQAKKYGLRLSIFDEPSKNHDGWNRKMKRQKDDWYPTPPEATQALLDVEKFHGRNAALWEPACGDGAICKVLEANGYEFWATDLNDYGYGDKTGIDFLMETKPWGSAIITNPPYKLAEPFITHAIDLGCTKHAWLLRLSFLEGIQRHSRLFATHPPMRVHVFSRRLTIWRGDQEIAGSGTTAYAWFVWEAGYTGAPEIGWLT